MLAIPARHSRHAPVIPATHPVIPAAHPVIPAQAGIHREGREEITAITILSDQYSGVLAS